MNDLKFAFRQLCKSPGFTLVAVLTLALGIGLNTAIFSLFNDLFLRGLPFKEPSRVVHLYGGEKARDGSLNGNPRKKRSLIKLKIAVLSPIPSASVKTATSVNPGDLQSWRKANFRSFISLGAEGLNRINTCGTSRREQTCN